MKADRDSWTYATGFVKVPRFIVETLARDPLALAVYVVLLGRARYAVGVEYTGHGLVEVQVGEAVCGRAELAAVCGASEAKIRTAIERLERLSVIAVRTTKRGTIATLLRYSETYARDGEASPTDSPRNRQEIAKRSPSDRQAIATNRDREKERQGDRETLRAHARTSFPSDWKPNDGHREQATQLGLDAEASAIEFRDHAIANARRYADWDAAFRVWIANAAKFAARSRSTTNGKNGHVGRVDISQFTEDDYDPKHAVRIFGRKAVKA